MPILVEVGLRDRAWQVGIAGAGWVTQYHLPAWRKLAGRAEVVAISDPQQVALRTRSDEFGIARSFPSAEAMLDAEDLDIIDVCTPVEAHAPLVRLAAERGMAVICQKPLAPSLDEAETLVAGLMPAARVMVHDNWRFRATYRRIKQWLDAGLVGDIRRVQLDYLSSGMIPDATGSRPALVRQPNFRHLKRLLLGEVMIHHVDTLRFLLGEMELVSSHLSRSNDDIIGEDAATLTLCVLSEGTPVLLTGNLAQRGEPQQARDQLRIEGAKATVVLDGYRLSRVGEDSVTEDYDPAATYQGAYDTAIAHFVDGLDGATSFETAPADHLRTLSLVEAAYRYAGEVTSRTATGRPPGAAASC